MRDLGSAADQHWAFSEAYGDIGRRPIPGEPWRTDSAAMDCTGGLWAGAGHSPRRGWS